MIASIIILIGLIMFGGGYQVVTVTQNWPWVQ
ncbi:hypothetical protein LFAB_11040 [Lactiplantibacillus fabifermentans T30PCM01]|uniref:Uncharacterized protein n=1 Tax=Lactiplantibacillus fabifermentans T30PCM01 TaxID=1400520 RepID=W6T6B3_9LACO|nr:hypothetical protein LFAB_11040 [Lactiplantibacillus fabifermentans T30PCM01]